MTYEHIKVHLTMMGRECSRLDSSYQRHVTFAGSRCYQLHPHHYLGIITPTYRRYQFTDPERWIAWCSMAQCMQIVYCQRLLDN